MFAEEAEGRLATLSELLLELERDGGDRELLSSIFREAHTLKGGAAVVGLDEVMRVAHAMEEVLEGLRSGGATATRGWSTPCSGPWTGSGSCSRRSWPGRTGPSRPGRWWSPSRRRHRAPSRPRPHRSRSPPRRLPPPH